MFLLTKDAVINVDFPREQSENGKLHVDERESYLTATACEFQVPSYTVMVAPAPRNSPCFTSFLEHVGMSPISVLMKVRKL